MKLEELNEASPAGAGTHHSAAVDAGDQGWSLSHQTNFVLSSGQPIGRICFPW